MGYYGWRPYVSVAERRLKAKCKMKNLQKKGKKIYPIKIEGRKIATTFWGKNWCNHIESFSDYENRLPRGRSYVRNGSICHLEINKGNIKAFVVGSNLYNVNIDISFLQKKKWNNIKKICSGKIESLLDLLSGKLSDGVMNVVCHREQGLFPLVNEIKLSCSCPDWAEMCKHVAAVLYAVGSRLDTDPAKLFLLRGVDHNELVDVSSAVIDATKSKKKKTHIDDSNLSNLFGIDIVEKSKSQQKAKSKKIIIKNPKVKSKKTKFPKLLNGICIKRKRKIWKLTQKEFANKIKVSTSTICRWEAEKRKKIVLSEKSLKALKKIWM